MTVNVVMMMFAVSRTMTGDGQSDSTRLLRRSICQTAFEFPTRDGPTESFAHRIVCHRRMILASALVRVVVATPLHPYVGMASSPLRTTADLQLPTVAEALNR